MQFSAITWSCPATRGKQRLWLQGYAWDNFRVPYPLNGYSK